VGPRLPPTITHTRLHPGATAATAACVRRSLRAAAPEPRCTGCCWIRQQRTPLLLVAPAWGHFGPSRSCANGRGRTITHTRRAVAGRAAHVSAVARRKAEGAAWNGRQVKPIAASHADSEAGVNSAANTPCGCPVALIWLRMTRPRTLRRTPPPDADPALRKTPV
jgi:hypothetical protein